MIIDLSAYLDVEPEEDFERPGMYAKEYTEQLLTRVRKQLAEESSRSRGPGRGRTRKSKLCCVYPDGRTVTKFTRDWSNTIDGVSVDLIVARLSSNKRPNARQWSVYDAIHTPKGTVGRPKA